MPIFAQRLVDSFGPAAEATRQGVRTLYDAIVGGSEPAAQSAFEQWNEVVAGPLGHGAGPTPSAAAILARRYGIMRDERLRSAELLFAVHTHYAVLVKLLVWQILARWHGLPTPLDRLGHHDTTHWSAAVGEQLAELETGGVLADLNVVQPFGDQLFSWYTGLPEEAIGPVVRSLAERVAQFDPGGLRRGGTVRGDVFKALYEGLLPKQVRHCLGEYYTPDWLAELVLDEAGYHGQDNARLLDPACGSGTFLVLAIQRRRAAWRSDDGGGKESRSGGGSVSGAPESGRLCRQILASVVGFDLNPLAVLSARANYLIAIGDLLGEAGRVEVPVFLRDSILAGQGDSTAGEGRFDFVVGNPPWIAWDNLPARYRERSKPLWQRYGLFTLSASEARHGGGKKDLAILMLYASADRYLKEGGRLGMVVTQTLFQSKGAGDGFRRFRLGAAGPWLRVLRVNDLVGCRPFPGAANWTATVVLEKGQPTTYPVPYVRWSAEGDDCHGKPSTPRGFQRQVYQAQPIDPARPSSPWSLRPAGLETEWSRMIGPSDYQAHLGANTAGANGVYWLRVLGPCEGGVRVRNIAARGKRQVEAVEQVIEPGLLYPLLRWADVARWRAEPSAHLLLVQDAHSRRGIEQAVLRREYAKTHAYLERFTQVLSGRAAYRRYQGNAPFYSMYNVGPYTLAPLKVVWRRMDRRLNAAVVEAIDDPLLGRRPVIPQETCVLVAAGSPDEAHYLCAVLNSAVVGALVAAHSVRGGKGFGTPSILDYVRLRRFRPSDPIHRELAAASRQAHECARHGAGFAEIEERIDDLAARLWGLSDRELEAIRGPR